MLLIPAGQVTLADSAAASSCPGPTGHVKKRLMRLVDKWGDAENELSTPQTAVTRSLENEEIRMLMPGKDEKACRALYRAMLISGVWSDLKKRRILLVDHQNDHNRSEERRVGKARMSEM